MNSRKLLHEDASAPSYSATLAPAGSLALIASAQLDALVPLLETNNAAPTAMIRTSTPATTAPMSRPVGFRSTSVGFVTREAVAGITGGASIDPSGDILAASAGLLVGSWAPQLVQNRWPTADGDPQCVQSAISAAP